MSEKIIQETLDEIMGDRFGKYSKYIIQDRALPDVRDGLKPVQRRILYAMYKEGNTYNKPYRKSAKTVGNVIGNYHPHGDTSVYDAMVRLSQEWKIRFPLVDMQGNNGSIDNDPAAAMRYTEARLAAIANELLVDIDKETVQMALNFDDTEYEPTVLPAKFPHLLVNGATGISAGYATDIPPHNLHEVIDAAIYKIDHNKATLDDLMQFIKGPDFPTGAIVEGKEEIKKAFETGKGKVVVRSKVEIVEQKNINQIVVSEIPYEVNKAELVRRIDELSHNKSIDGVIEVRDESDRHGLCIVIDLKKDVNVQNTLNYFYKNTDLQKNYSYNMVAIKNRRPVLMGIVEILDGYINHLQEVITKRSIFELNKANERQHIVEGLIKAVSILDEVVKCIRKSKDKADAKKNLMIEFGFSEKQAEAIVMLQLYRLTNTDILTLENEHKDLSEKIAMLEDILGNEKVLRKVMISELKEIKNKYPSPRLTEIKDDVLNVTVDEEAMLLPEDIIVSVTKDGYIKRISLRSYNASENIPFGKKDDDQLIDIHKANTVNKLLVFTDLGNYLYIPLHKLEEFKWKDTGKHISYLSKLSTNEHIVSSILVKDFNTPVYVLIASKNGLIKRTELKEFEVQRYSKAIKCMNLIEGDQVIDVALTNGQQGIVLTTVAGYGCLYSENEVSVLGIKAKGIKSMNVKNDAIASMNIFDPTKTGSYLLVGDNLGIKRLHLDDIASTKRAQKGTLVFKTPKSNPIHTLKTYILSNKDVLTFITKNDHFDLNVTDLSYSNTSSKPSVIELLKGQELVDIYDQRTYTSDMYGNAVSDTLKTDNKIFEVEKEPELFDDQDIEEVPVEEIIVKKKPKEKKEKTFETISFDDLFKDDF